MLLAAALIGALGLFAAACDDDAETQNNAQQSDVDTLTARIQRNEMREAVLTLGTLNLHGMDTALNETSKIDASYSRNTTTALRVLATTYWGPHQEDAEAVREAGIDLLAALHDEDADAAKPAATALHDTEHDLSTAVWAELLGDLPPEEGGVEEHSDEGGETPAAGATP
ncbi:MAG: hypothetical protein WEB52_13720 [Dehalococcoidia bacterium]